LARWKKRRNSAGLPAMLRLAGCALVENEYTATFAARYCAQVEVITGPIDTERYTAKQVERDNNKAEIVLGWIGSATTLPYLELIRDPLERLGRRCTHVRLQVIGAEYIDWSGIRVDAKAWNLAEEVEDLEGFDIGLMPIPDDPWTRGKGGYKLLQYMAMGLPVVTSPVGINREIVENGKSGYWACESQQWEACLGRLIDDEGLRRRMGQHGRSVVETRYALDVQAQRLVDLLHGLKNKVEG
jgi:glycosyltransferase involved in cell wall biosynthesis